MYINSKLSLVCLVFCFSSFAFAQKAAAPPPTSTTSTFEIVRKSDREVFTTTNRQFKYVPLFNEDSYKSLLLLEEIRLDVSPDVEGSNGTLKVDAWIGKGSKPDKKAWTIKSDANAGEAGDTFYKTTNFGCCASYNVMTWYNLLSGQKIYSGTNNFVKISVPNTGGSALDRYVTFHSNQGTTNSPEMKRMKNVLGVLQYGTSKRVMHRVIIVAADQDTLDGSAVPEMGVAHQEETKFAKDDQEESIDLWKHNNKNATTSLSDFTVILKFDDDKKIVIPFKNDAPVLSEAKLPAKMTLSFNQK